MISASFSLSLPRLGWKSTSMPRSLNICTAAGDSASEMRTLGLAIGCDPLLDDAFDGATAGFVPRVHLFSMDGRVKPGHDDDGGKRTDLRRLRKLRLGLGECPVDPLRQQRDIAGFDGGAAPDTQPRRRVAIMREIVAGAFLLDQGDQLLG